MEANLDLILVTILQICKDQDSKFHLIAMVVSLQVFRDIHIIFPYACMQFDPCSVSDSLLQLGFIVSYQLPVL